MKTVKIYTVWPQHNDSAHPNRATIPTATGAEFIDHILNSENSHLVYVAPEEFAMGCSTEVTQAQGQRLIELLQNRIDQHNLQVSVILGRHHKHLSNEKYDQMSVLKQVADIHYWPTYWFTAAAYNDLYNRDLTAYHNTQVDKTFVCLNGKPHPHRCFFMDQLAKENLIDSNLVSWVITQDQYEQSCNYQWLYWQEHYRAFESFVMEDRHPQYALTDPEGYYHTLFDVITETTTSCVFWTEKTARPLMLGKPFVILGCESANTQLQELGFELYDEIFDYAFDHEPDFEQRVTLLVQQLVELDQNKQKHSELRKQILPKAKRNQQRFLEIIADQTKVPMYNLLGQYLSKYQIMMSQAAQLVSRLRL